MLYSFLLAVSFYYYYLYINSCSRKYFTISCILICVSILFKPSSQIILIVYFIGIFIVRGKKYMPNIGIFLLTFLAVVGSWMYRNYNKYDLFTSSEIPSEILYYYIALPSTYNSFNFNINSWKDYDSKMENHIKIVKSQNLKLPKEIKVFLYDEAKKIILNNFPIVIKESFVGFLRTILGTGYECYQQNFMPKNRHENKILLYVPLIINIIQWLLLLFAFYTYFVLKKKEIINTKSFIFLFVIMLFIILPSSNIAAHSKYRMPAIPLLIFFDVLGIYYIKQIFKKKIASPKKSTHPIV